MSGPYLKRERGMREQFFHGGIGELTLRQAFNLFQQKAWNVLTVCHNVSTRQEYVWSFPASIHAPGKLSRTVRRDGRDRGGGGGGGGLVSYSGCRLGETHSHHPDRRGSLRIHAPGWRHLSGLLHLQSNLRRRGKEAAEVFVPFQVSAVDPQNLRKLHFLIAY